MKLSKDNTTLFLEKTSLCLSIVMTVLCAFLYGKAVGFLEGENSAISAFAPSVLEEGSISFSNSSLPDDFEVISNSYLFIFVISLSVLLIHLFGRKILSKYLILFLLLLPIFEYYSVFKSKFILMQYPRDFPRFELLRQAIIFDIVGAIAIISLFVSQMILVFLILRKQKTM